MYYEYGLRRRQSVAAPLFVSQAKLEAWIDKGDVTFVDDVLTILAQQRSFTLAPAARVTKLIDGQDTHGLIGRVLTKADMEGLKAEHFPGTLILGDTGFECEEGFVGTEKLAAAAEPALSLPEHAPPPAAPAAAAADPQSDMDLLADFLLKHL
jgi:hypothetical protein